MTGEMRQLLAQASVVAEAAAMNLEADKTSHSKPGSTILTSPGWSTQEEMARRFSHAYTDRDQREAVTWARKELDRVKGRNRPKPRNERTMVLREWAGTNFKDVSAITRVSRSTVRRWREEDGADPTSGLKTWESKLQKSRRAA